MVAIDQTGEQAGTDPSEDPPSSGDQVVRRRRRSVVVGIAVAAVASAVALVLLRGGDDGRSVEDVAVSFSQRLMTFEPDAADESIDSVLELSAGEFAENYTAAAEAGLGEVLQRAGTVSRATARSVFVGPVDDGAATVIVELRITRRTTDLPETTFTTYLRLEMVDEDGWAVGDVTPLEETRSSLVTGEGDEPSPTSSAPGSSAPTSSPSTTSGG